MAVPCTEHLFLTGRKARSRGFHLLRAAEGQQPSPENLVCLCGERRTDLFDRLGPAALADAADCDVIVMDELGPSEAAALEFQKAVLAALDGDKPVYGVLQQADSEFLSRVAAHPRVRVVTVTEENRDRLQRQLCGEK